MGATFGKKAGDCKPNQTQFLKKQTGTIKIPEKPTKFSYDPSFKKENIPKQADKPIMGLVSDKNYIVANAVENILAAPKMPMKNEFDPLVKKDYGKIPKFMTKIKKEIEEEYQLVREMQV